MICVGMEPRPLLTTEWSYLSGDMLYHQLTFTTFMICEWKNDWMDLWVDGGTVGLSFDGEVYRIIRYIQIIDKLDI